MKPLRSVVLGFLGLVMVCPVVLPGAPAAKPKPATQAGVGSVVMTGKVGPGLDAFDHMMTALLQKHHCPGGALAVAKHGRLVVLRGYGYADKAQQVKVDASRTRFNIASCSKSLTAVALLRLVDAGKVSLNDRAVDRLPKAALPTSGMPAEFNQVTLAMLLRHTSGLPDGSPPARKLASKLGCKLPLSLYQVICGSLMFPLRYQPGTRAVYSNLGYEVLGAIVANVSGDKPHAVTGAASTDTDNESYEDAVEDQVFKPAGITDPLTENASRPYATDEAHYYFPNGAMQPKPADPPFNTACGGWCLTAVDMVRFLTTLDGTRAPQSGANPYLSTATLNAMLTRPKNNSFRNNGTYFGLGWDVVWTTAANHQPDRTATIGNNWSKNGDHPANFANFGHQAPDIDWAIVVNGGTNTGSIDTDMGHGIAPVINQVTKWPNVDYF